MRNVKPEEATMLACGSTAYIKMFNVLPYMLPRRDSKELIQAQLLCGIKTGDINSRLEEPMNYTRISRIKHYPLMPEAEYIKAPDKILSNEVTIAIQFYLKILKPIQLPIYNPDEDTYLKWYQIQSICRGTMLSVIFIHDPDVSKMIRETQAARTASKGFIINTYGRTANICKLVHSAQSNVNNLYKKNDSDLVQLSYKYEMEIDKVYDFLYRIRVQGILNDKLMEAAYEYPFARP